MREQSQKDEMAAALKGDFQRLRKRGVATTLGPAGAEDEAGLEEARTEEARTEETERAPVGAAVPAEPAHPAPAAALGWGADGGPPPRAPVLTRPAVPLRATGTPPLAVDAVGAVPVAAAVPAADEPESVVSAVAAPPPRVLPAEPPAASNGEGTSCEPGHTGAAEPAPAAGSAPRRSFVRRLLGRRG